jgi:heme-degrading monooxygenase HmoA
VTIIRVWRTRIDQRRADEYERFADDESLPMFHAHDGFIGVVFGEAKDERVVITLWSDAEAVAALESSMAYRDTVARIEATGFILGPSSVEQFMVQGAAIDGTF